MLVVSVRFLFHAAVLTPQSGCNYGLQFRSAAREIARKLGEGGG